MEPLLRRALLAALPAALAVAPAPAFAQPRAVLVASGLSSPLQVAAPPGDSERLFVVEQRGRVRVVRNGAVASTFLDVSSKVSCCGERGLLGLAFHPRYFETGRFFVNYTDAAGSTVVAEYRVSADPDRADPASERVLLRQVQPYSNHNGGNLEFSPLDGYLYVGLGDGGSAGDPQDNAQSDFTWLGKLLRLDVDRVDGVRPYGVPPDNPFASAGTPRAEQWAKGLRNPWRYRFDRLTGDLYLGDVGQGAREEIDFQPVTSTGGENYGWRLMEGTACYDPPSGCQTGRTLTLPVFEYRHERGRCSVTGGPLVRSASLPELDGRYLFGDYCTGELWSVLPRDGAATDLRDHTAESAPGGGRAISQVSSFGEDALGRVYVCDMADGEVYRLESAGRSAARSVPVVVDTPGAFGARFSTALAVANTGSTDATLTLTYTAADSVGASGSGPVTEPLPAGTQLLLGDVVAFLRAKGLSIPQGDDVRNVGTLEIAASGVTPSGSLAVAARVTTPSGNGRAGVSFGAPRPSLLFERSALVYGLRESASERTNLAFSNSGPGTLRLRLTIVPGHGGLGPWYVWPEEIVLGPGQWRQLDAPLASIGIGNATARVEKVSGEGPFSAYAVVNDNATNDGSFLPAVLPERPRDTVVVPVLVETVRFESELVLVNPNDRPVTAALFWMESLSTGAPRLLVTTEALDPYVQRIVPRAAELFRQSGASVGPPGGSYAGALFVSFSFADGRRAGGIAAVRALAPLSTGAAYGVFLPGVPFGETSVAEASVAGLTHGASSRSNLAVLHAGGSPGPITLRIEVHAPDGARAGEVTRTLVSGEWAQEDGILSRFGLAEGRVRVVRTAGTGRFLAYAVVNDGGTVATGTNDGSALLAE